MEPIHLTKLDILLAGDTKRFSRADEVSGLLQITIKGPLMLSAVTIGLVCMAECRWVENPGTRYHREGHVYHNKRKLLDYTYQIPGKYADNCLSPGDHVIPFMFKLPEKDIPSSFESTHGSVTYFVEAVIDEPAINEVHRIGYPIVVEAPIINNLNLSVGGSSEKDLSVINLASGHITLIANVTKKGFLSGELVEVHVTVDNKSSVDVTPRATLYQTQVYMCGERHKGLEVPLTNPLVGTLVSAESSNDEIIYLRMPAEASLSIKSPIITIKYFIHVTLDIPHAIDLHVNLPIIVTTGSAFNLSNND
ncbi:arrestin domain-containing protein 3-like [Oppia nitens]|uniref:arrestin domain-containing protein 3-like n=1 Tax=Oppia nitens TaxID=1686743 RepID=UPI0023DAEC5A|nr:arrestin domain-containing protein 3-like [Oppia nitens]